MRLQEIKKAYNIETDNLEEIRSELKVKLKEVHPDNNSGEYDSNVFAKLLEDIDYVENEMKQEESTELSIPLSQVVSLLEKYQKNEIIPVKTEEMLQNKLTGAIEARVLKLKAEIRNRRIGTTTITAVLTFLWFFPEQITSHPVFEYFFENFYEEELIFALSLFFMYTWFLSCVSLANVWIRTARIEMLEKEIYEKAKLDYIQNDIFMRFIDDMGEREKFDKQQLMEYVRRELEQQEIRLPRWARLRNVRVSLSEEVVQDVAEILLERAINHNVIEKAQSYSLIDTYKICKREE